MRFYREDREAREPKGNTAGSTYLNPPNASYKAGELLDLAGMKGKQHGQAQLSPAHANFLMNLGKATSGEVLQLMSLAEECVREKFGINLEPEIEFIGEV